MHAATIAATIAIGPAKDVFELAFAGSWGGLSSASAGPAPG